MNPACTVRAPPAHDILSFRAQHIDLGLKYDPSIGIYGMDFYVVMGRPGFRVARRRRCKSRVGPSHRISKEETIKWFQTTVRCVGPALCPDAPGAHFARHRSTTASSSTSKGAAAFSLVNIPN